MSYILFHEVSAKNKKEVALSVDLLQSLILADQKDSWIDLFCGGIPNERLEWKGSLQEAYFLFNQIRINTIEGNSLVKIYTKNRGLDWVKINKVINTKYGKIQKESRPNHNTTLNEGLLLWVGKLSLR